MAKQWQAEWETLPVDQNILIVGREFDRDFYERHKEIFHMLRFKDWRDEPILDIIGYNHQYQKDPMVVVGVAIDCYEHGDINWTPSSQSISEFIDAKNKVIGPFEVIRPIEEAETEESFDEMEVAVYHGQSRMLVTTRKLWTDRTDLLLL